jgi:biotin carboxyl carrier protein
VPGRPRATYHDAAGGCGRCSRCGGGRRHRSPAVAPAARRLAHRSHASPSVRLLARELGVDLTRVPASGPKGRILKEDVTAYVKGVMTAAPALAAAPSLGGGLDLLPWPKVDFAKFGPVEVKPLARIKKISAQNLARNWVMIPAVTYHEDADITDLEAFRVAMNKENEKSGLKITMLAFLIKACTVALKKFPEFNSSLDGDNLVLKQYCHIAFAADTPNGLVVPVIKNADQKSVANSPSRAANWPKRRATASSDRRDVRCLLHHLQPRRHRRHLFLADHQRAGSRHPRRQPVGDEAGLERPRVRAAADPADVPDRRPPRHRRRAGDPLQRLCRATARRHAARAALIGRKIMSQIIEVKVPDIGDYHDVPVIDICVAVGDTVQVDDALVTLESDKATMDVPSSVAGVVKEVKVKPRRRSRKERWWR